MAAAPKVSILVPVYRVEDYLESALDSILAQTLKDIEVICLDEGEDDACYDILLEYASRDPRIRIEHKKHGGYGPALCAGLSMASGEYIGFVDPDDTILPKMYSELYDYARYIEADVVKSPWIQKTQDGRESIKLPIYDLPKWRTFKAKDYPHIFSLHPSIWSGLYRRDFLIQNRITFTERMFSDQKFRIRTLLETSRVGWYDKSFYKYTMSRTGSATLNWDIDLMLRIWLDIHRMIPGDIFNLISQFLIEEEFLCIFQRSVISGIVNKKNNDLFLKLKNCINYISYSDIENSPVLRRKNKRYLLDLKDTNSLNDLIRLYKYRNSGLRKIYKFLNII